MFFSGPTNISAVCPREAADKRSHLSWAEKCKPNEQEKTYRRRGKEPSLRDLHDAALPRKSNAAWLADTARAFGAHGERVGDPDELHETIAHAIQEAVISVNPNCRSLKSL